MVCCQGCAGPDTWQYGFSAQVIAPQDFHFRDGGRAIYFSFDKSLETGVSVKPLMRVDTFLFVVSGSGCTSMQYFLPQYFRGLEGESGPLRIFVLQKRFIEARTWGRIWGCGNDFIQADHPSRWIADQAEFINAQLIIAQRNATLPSRIVVVGISEGGDIVPLLAQRIPAVTHAVIIANGGMNPIDAYRLQAQKRGFAAALKALDALDRPPANPDSPAHYIAGRTWRYWWELRGLKHTDNLLALSIPISIAMGEADQAVPVESAWYIREQFFRHGKSNLNLMVYPEVGHSLENEKHAFLPDFWHTLDLSLEKK